MYATPLARNLSKLPFPDVPALKLPGTKVLHIADVDVNSQCKRVESVQLFSVEGIQRLTNSVSRLHICRLPTASPNMVQSQSRPYLDPHYARVQEPRALHCSFRWCAR